MTPKTCTITVHTTNTLGFWDGPKRLVEHYDLLVDLPPHTKAGRSYTATGYGFRIPTRFMVVVNGKRRRIYSCRFSNQETLFIGPSLERGRIVELW